MTTASVLSIRPRLLWKIMHLEPRAAPAAFTDSSSGLPAWGQGGADHTTDPGVSFCLSTLTNYRGPVWYGTSHHMILFLLLLFICSFIYFLVLAMGVSASVLAPRSIVRVFHLHYSFWYGNGDICRNKSTQNGEKVTIPPVDKVYESTLLKKKKVLMIR